MKYAKPKPYAIICLNAFEEAAVDWAFAGSAPPEDRELLLKRYNQARARVKRQLKEDK